MLMYVPIVYGFLPEINVFVFVLFVFVIVGRCHTQQAVQKMYNSYQKGPLLGCLRDYNLYVHQENSFSTYQVFGSD